MVCLQIEVLMFALFSSYCSTFTQKMAEDASIKTSAKNCQASNGNNNISSHGPSISCMQNIKEQIPKYQVMFITFLACIYPFYWRGLYIKALTYMHWMTSYAFSILQVNINLEISTVSLKCCRGRMCGYILTFWSTLVLSFKELQKIFDSIIICEGHKKHYTILLFLFWKMSTCASDQFWRSCWTCYINSPFSLSYYNMKFLRELFFRYSGCFSVKA